MNSIVLNKGLAALWVLLGMWAFSKGFDIIMDYPGERKSPFGYHFYTPIEYVFENITIGTFSFAIAGVVFTEKKNRVSYLFVLLGILLIFTVTRNVVQLGGFGPVMLLTPLIFLTKLRLCLLTFMISLASFYIMRKNQLASHQGLVYFSINSTCYLLAFVSYLARINHSEPFNEIKINWNFRLMLLIGFAPILLAQFISFEDFLPWIH